MYSILRPFSNTNPTNLFRVVRYEEWVSTVFEVRVGKVDGLTAQSYEDAVAIRDGLNASVAKH